jgi:hypothetical protein
MYVLIIKCVCMVTTGFLRLQIELESSLNKWVIECYYLFMVLGVMHINEIFERFTQITKAQMHFLRRLILLIPFKFTAKEYQARLGCT